MNSQEQSSKNRLWLDAEGPEPSLAEEPSGDRQRDMLAETGSVDYRRGRPYDPLPDHYRAD